MHFASLSSVGPDFNGENTAGNYVLDVATNGEAGSDTALAIYMVDSRDYNDQGDGYGFVHADQVTSFRLFVLQHTPLLYVTAAAAATTAAVAIAAANALKSALLSLGLGLTLILSLTLTLTPSPHSFS